MLYLKSRQRQTHTHMPLGEGWGKKTERPKSQQHVTHFNIIIISILQSQGINFLGYQCYLLGWVLVGTLS